MVPCCGLYVAEMMKLGVHPKNYLSTLPKLIVSSLNKVM